ncbi:MAG TPA: hypothetical protein VGH44_02270 [Candidatus Saccharimonadia bacterium]|jgi:hypothetical protein
MTDDEMRKMVHHLAELHGVTPEHFVKTVAEGKEPEDGHNREVAEAEVEEGEGRRRRLWRPGVWVTLGVVGAVFGFCIVFLLNFVNGAVSAGPDQSKVLGEAKASIAPSSSVLPSIKGLHISFSYPQTFSDSRPVRDIKAGLEGYVLLQHDGSGAQIAVTVSKLPSGQLQDDSGYLWRTAVSKDYEPASPTKVLGEPAEIMVKKDGSEHTLYWAHAGMLVTVAVTSTSGGDLAGYLRTVQDSLWWQG